jgi:hypothetical protein
MFNLDIFFFELLPVEPSVVEIADMFLRKPVLTAEKVPAPTLDPCETNLCPALPAFSLVVLQIEYIQKIPTYLRRLAVGKLLNCLVCWL